MTTEQSSYSGLTPRDMSKRSMAAIEAKDRDGWLGLFAEDAVVEDPIGRSMLDPEGLGHCGLEAIARFFDEVIAPNDKIKFTINLSYESGPEVANVGTIDITFPGGSQIASVDLVSTYRIGPDGRLTSLRAYWEPENMRVRDA
ncbi:MAG: nuclear transport factor 2 family protein [Acidimicrobiales bacterium]